MDCLETNGAGVTDPPSYTLISTDEAFRSMLERLTAAPRLAIDIEADSLYHYFEKVCLIQISTDIDTFILDPLSITLIGELGPILSNPAVEKVFHAAGYDVFCLRRDYGFAFANIFDTYIAAQLLGHEFLGLSALMEAILGIYHSKRRQRDDWSHRPLAEEQLEYAAMDTHHLLRLRDDLEIKLKDKGRLSWAQEEFAAAAVIERPEKEFDTEGFRRIKGNRDLSLQEQAMLRAIFLTRDRIARQLDVPSFKVLNNSVLIELVKKPPKSAREMFDRPGVSYRVARKFSDEILQTLEESRQQDPTFPESPQRNNWKPPSRAVRLRLESLRNWRQAKSKELGLNIGVVFPANLLENLAAVPPADLQEMSGLPGMRQWRVREFGGELLHVVNSPDLQSVEPSGK
jgi:ribonuclease D